MKRDKELGRQLTTAEAAEYQQAYRQGSELLSRHIDLQGREPAPSPKREAEVREGIRLLQKAVALEPRSWPALWLLGKGHQALGDHPRACEAFRDAARLSADNPDVPREFCLECLHLGKFGEAVAAARQAVRLKRSDPGLQANLALALLLNGDIDEALDQAEQAAARAPRDDINQFLLKVATDVKEGRLPQPRSLAELEA
jgi:Flp pilus assembly protein TadD